MSRVQAYLYLLFVIAIVVASFAVFTRRPLYVVPEQDISVRSELIANAPIPQPPLTDAVRQQLAASNGFQELVSYTDRGFEPPEFSIAKGDTVRFTNNSHDDMWVAATGSAGSIYPGVQNGCGSSTFDSCGPVTSGEFWEMTFDTAGTWSYANNLKKDHAGVIVVK